jgi:pimeloyl-ACP methyl ester carboxylesterase
MHWTSIVWTSWGTIVVAALPQIFAALHPERIRSLTLTDCDTHDNWPPEAFKPFLAMAAGDGLRGTLDAILEDKSIYRSPGALRPAYEQPEKVSDDTLETYLRPFVVTEQRTRDLQRFLAMAIHRKQSVKPSPWLSMPVPWAAIWRIVFRRMGNSAR